MPWTKIADTTSLQEIATGIKMPLKIEICDHANVIFAKLSLFGNKIIVYDYLGEATEFPTDPPSKVKQIMARFIGKILEAFKLIDNNNIGKILLGDIVKSSSPVIIFPHDFCGKYKILNDNNFTKLLPEDVYHTFPNRKGFGSVTQFKMIARQKRCFVAPNNDWRNCTIFFKISDATEVCTGFKPISSDQQSNFSPILDTYMIQLENGILLKDDICLFHELNHARHFLKNFATYWESECLFPLENAYDGNSSLFESLKSEQVKGCKYLDETLVKNPFGSAEEELQLIGDTIISKQKLMERRTKIFDRYCEYYDILNPDLIILGDPVNEIAYSFFYSYPIRFPYNSIKDPKKMVISGSDLRLLLRFALREQARSPYYMHN
jgi:hypothetical protein